MGVYSVQDYVLYILILFVILAVFVKVFERIKLDGKFIIAISPFILVGILIRVLADTKVFEFNQWWSVTPGVYIVTLLIASASIAAGLIIRKFLGIEYLIAPFVSGSLIAIYLVYRLLPYIENPLRIFFPLFLAFSITAAIYATSVLLKKTLFQKISNLAIIYAHMLDASSTFIAFNFFGFYEEHILPIYFISLAGDNALIMVPIKLIVVGLTLYFIEKWYSEEKKTEKNRTVYIMIKLLIFIIGIGPGLRNTLLPALRL